MEIAACLISNLPRHLENQLNRWMNDLQLRPAQQKILEYENGRLAISAVPGSGKTFTLSLLAAKLIGNGHFDNPNRVGQLSAAVLTSIRQIIPKRKSWQCKTSQLFLLILIYFSYGISKRKFQGPLICKLGPGVSLFEPINSLTCNCQLPFSLKSTALKYAI